MKVVVVGAGLGGLFAARAFADRGHRVLLVADGPGGFAVGAGIASRAFWDPALRPLATRSLRILAGLVPTDRCGMAQIALSERTAATLARLPGTGRRLSAPLRDAFAPAFRRRIAAVAHSPDDLRLDLTALRRALLRGLARRRERVVEVAPGRVRTARGEHRADLVVVATGWRADLRAHMRLPAVSLRTAAVVRGEGSLPAMFHVLDTGLYARPDGTGFLAGDGDGPGEADRPPPRRPEPPTVERIAAGLRAVLRRVGRVRPVSAGLLARTRSRRPFVVERAGLVVLGGLGGDGLSLAPAIGERLADRRQ